MAPPPDSARNWIPDYSTPKARACTASGLPTCRETPLSCSPPGSGFQPGFNKGICCRSSQPFYLSNRSARRIDCCWNEKISAKSSCGSELHAQAWHSRRSPSILARGGRRFAQPCDECTSTRWDVPVSPCSTSLTPSVGTEGSQHTETRKRQRPRVYLSESAQ